MTAGLVFNPEGHEYHFDGVRVPSVTQVLEPLYDFSAIPADVLARAGEFGGHVHTATELYDHGTLDEDALDPALGEYLNGWKKFLSICPVVFSHIETRVFSKKYRYAGTLDRGGLYLAKDCLFDIKTGVKSPVTGPQTAAYAKAHQEMTGQRFKKRFTVQLRPDDFKLIEHNDKNDFNIFLSCLNVHNFKVANNI